jgi:hypothetical protein
MARSKKAAGGVGVSASGDEHVDDLAELVDGGTVASADH